MPNKICPSPEQDGPVWEQGWTSAGTMPANTKLCHAAINVPAYLQSVKIPAGYFNSREFSRKIE